MNDNEQAKKPNDAPETPKASEETPVQADHALTLGERTLRYQSTAGRLPIKDDKGEIKAQMYFTAYTLAAEPDLQTSPDPAQRPLTFVFNGGPGSSSIWLHMGALGPKRVQMQDEGWMPEPPFRLVPNEQTWLDQSDLVFIDPIGTGYSRAINEDDAKTYWNLEKDFESIAQFIHRYLTRHQRWGSPLFLAGESYGTTRAAGLSRVLLDKGIALNGVILLSIILNFQTLRFTRGNDLPFMLYVPSFSATAWYHGQLNETLQAKALPDLLTEVETWAETDYQQALTLGDRLKDDEERWQAIRDQLARYLGLSAAYVEQSNLRVEIMRFCKELLRHEGRTVGRLDSRYKGIDPLPLGDMFEFDPSMAAIVPPFTAMFNDYARRELRYESDLEYEALSFKVNQGWEWPRGEFPDTSESLRNALSRNPTMQVMMAMGYYDLATPPFAAHYTFDHMNLDASLRDNLHAATYEAGHMFYLHLPSLAKLKQDVERFYASALGASSEG